MFIPRAMKTEMAKTFYDKEIHLMNVSTEVDDEGGVKNNSLSVKGKFKGNVNYSNCEKIQEDYGLDYKVNVSITTDYSELCKEDIFKYNDMLYKIKGIYIRDSHLLVLGVNWQA